MFRTDAKPASASDSCGRLQRLRAASASRGRRLERADATPIRWTALLTSFPTASPLVMLTARRPVCRCARMPSRFDDPALSMSTMVHLCSYDAMTGAWDDSLSCRCAPHPQRAIVRVVPSLQSADPARSRPPLVQASSTSFIDSIYADRSREARDAGTRFVRSHTRRRRATRCGPSPRTPSRSRPSSSLTHGCSTAACSTAVTLSVRTASTLAG